MNWKKILIVVLEVLFVGSMCRCEDEKEVVRDVGDRRCRNKNTWRRWVRIR